MSKVDLNKVAQAAGDAPFNAQQKWTELRDLLEYLAPKNLKNILEIGVYKGGTVFAWVNIAARDAHITAVDLPGGPHGGGFTEEEAKNIKTLAIADQKIEVLALDSQKDSTVKRLQKNAPFDMIFIDADHSYGGAKKDYTNYLPMVEPGGVMIFHDIVEMDQEDYPDSEVAGLWKEVKTKHKTREFVDLDFPSDHNPWGGIGVIEL